MPRPNICPHCAAEESLVAVGPGVERLQEEAAHIFPEARTMTPGDARRIPPQDQPANSANRVATAR